MHGHAEYLGGPHWRCLHCGASLRAECSCCEPPQCACLNRPIIKVELPWDCHLSAPRSIWATLTAPFEYQGWERIGGVGVMVWRPVPHIWISRWAVIVDHDAASTVMQVLAISEHHALAIAKGECTPGGRPQTAVKVR